MLLHLLVACCGCLLLSVKDIRNSPRYVGKLLREGDLLQVSLEEPLQARERSYRTSAAVLAVVRGRQVLPATGKVLLYFRKDTMVPGLQCGDAVLIKPALQPVGRTGNPGAFDYRRYCAYRQIFHQAYIRAGQWKRLQQPAGNAFRRCILQARAWCLRTLQQYIRSEPEASLAAALLIGYRYDLDKGMVQAYTSAGVVHIIAISGMHLALLYGSLVWLLRWWPAGRFADVMKALLVTGILWSFALITGASASVLRAAVMFTALATGQFVLDRYSSSYNTLAASAFLLLCYDPYLLADAGFQLSYLAVLGILCCYRPLYNLWPIPHKWPDKIWEAAALTIAAQLFTIPVCLYYFNQFPNLFLPVNLVVVTLSTLILYGLILLLLIAPLHAAAIYAGIALQHLIRWMNRIVLFTAQLPWAVTDNVYMPLYAVICAYVIMASLAACWLAKWKPGLQTAAFACLLWAAIYAADTIQTLHNRKIVVYNAPAYTAIDILQGRRVQFAGDTALLKTAAGQRYLQPARLLYRTRSAPVPALQRQGPFISIGGKRLVVIDSTWHSFIPRKKFRTDYILLSHDPEVGIKELKEMFACRLVIFDASNPPWKIRQWKNDCYELTLRCFSVPDQGAYLINF